MAIRKKYEFISVRNKRSIIMERMIYEIMLRHIHAKIVKNNAATSPARALVPSYIYV